MFFLAIFNETRIQDNASWKQMCQPHYVYQSTEAHAKIIRKDFCGGNGE